jgi:hypothetical protein
MTTKTTTIEERLYDYFIQTGSLSLPGVGTFRMERISAQTDNAGRRLLPPTFTVRYDRRVDAPKRDMFDYLARRNGGDEVKAVRVVNHLSYSIRTRLLQGESCELPGIGTLLPDNGTGFRFEPSRIQYDFIPDLPLRRVQRDDDRHPIRVGDDWVTRAEQEERLLDPAAEETVVRSPWKRAAWVLGLLALGLVLLRAFTIGGFSPFQSRYSPFPAQEPPPTHSTLTRP